MPDLKVATTKTLRGSFYCRQRKACKDAALGKCRLYSGGRDDAQTLAVFVVPTFIRLTVHEAGSFVVLTFRSAPRYLRRSPALSLPYRASDDESAASLENLQLSWLLSLFPNVLHQFSSAPVCRRTCGAADPVAISACCWRGRVFNSRLLLHARPRPPPGSG